MTERNELTQGLTITIQGVFAALFCATGVPDRNPPGWLAPVMAAGTVMAVLLALAGVALAVRARRNGGLAALADPAVRRRYLIILAIEVSLLALLIVLFWAIWDGAWIPALLAAAVGVHFLPLSGVFGDAQLFFSGVLLLAVAGVAALIGIRTDVVPNDITGPVTAFVLLAGALIAFAATVQPRRAAALA